MIHFTVQGAEIAIAVFAIWVVIVSIAVTVVDAGWRYVRGQS
jgi:hypothetical protein